MMTAVKRSYTRFSTEFIAKVVATRLLSDETNVAIAADFGINEIHVRRWTAQFRIDPDVVAGGDFECVTSAIIECVNNSRAAKKKRLADKRAEKARQRQAGIASALSEASVGIDEVAKLIATEAGTDTQALAAADLPDDPVELKRMVMQERLHRAIAEERVTMLGKCDAPRWGTKHDTVLVMNLRTRGFPLGVVLDALGLAASTFADARKKITQPHPHVARWDQLATAITSIAHEHAFRYGYRRIWQQLRAEGIRVSEKIVRTIMTMLGLCPKRARRRAYSSYHGESGITVPNLLHVNPQEATTACGSYPVVLSQRCQTRWAKEELTHDFYADKPNEKWVSDVSELSCKDGKVYVSPLIDMYDGFPIAVTVSEHPDTELVGAMLDHGLSQLKPGEQPILHTDRGGVYQSDQWRTLTKATTDAPLVRLSMSRKATSGDNAAMEGFFGTMKTEMFYCTGDSPANYTKREMITKLDDYLDWYIWRRTKKSLGYRTLAQHRQLAPIDNTHVA